MPSLKVPRFLALLLHVRHQVHVAVNIEYDDVLLGIAICMRMFNNVQHITILNMEDYVLKADSSYAFEKIILLIVPDEIAHTAYDLMVCALCQH